MVTVVGFYHSLKLMRSESLLIIIIIISIYYLFVTQSDSDRQTNLNIPQR